MADITEYEPKAVSICRAALIELYRYIGPLRDHIILIGGWVPYFLCGKPEIEDHIGSLDIDLSLDLKAIVAADRIGRIREILAQLGYYNRYPFALHRFFKEIRDEDGKDYWILLELFSSLDDKSLDKETSAELQSAQVFKLKGAELAFVNPLDLELTGTGQSDPDRVISA